MSDYILRLYRHHDRELLFDGTITEAKAAGIELQPAMRRIVWNGTKHIVLNQSTYPGELALWIAA